jgi:hypothetical protein
LIEQGIELIRTIADKGLAGVWEMLLEKIQGIEDMVISGIKSFIIETVVKKGVEWLLSLFNPAGAFVEAVELIIDVVQFFIQKGKQIQETVDRILDSVESLLSGGEGGVPALIEQTLAKGIPTVIQFLADLVGLGDLGTKLQALVQKAQSITDAAIDWLVDKAIGLVKVAWGALAGTSDADGSPEEQAAITDATAALSASRSSEEAEGLVAQVGARHSVLLKLVVESQDDAGEHVHVQTMKSATLVLPAHAGSAEDEEAASLFEAIAAETTADYLNNFQNWHTPRPGREAGQVHARPVQLSEHAADANKSAVEWFAGQSPASPAAQATAIAAAHALIDKAYASQEEASIYRYLRAAAVKIQDLYGGRDAFGLDIEHLTEVGQNKETFVRTQISRTYGSVIQRLRTGRPRASTPEVEIAKVASQARKREIARLYAEQLVDDEMLGDIGETSTGGEPEEIELKIITTTAHQAATSRRARERAGQ